MVESPGGLLGFLVEFGPPSVFALTTGWLMWRVFHRQNIKQIPEPDMRLEDVIRRIVGRSVLPLPNEPESRLVWDACERLREKALLGSIDVFGGINWRTTRPEDYDSMTRDRIKPDYWRSHRMHVVGFLEDDDRRGRTAPLDEDAFTEGFHGTAADNYYGIWLSQHQIDAIWPPPRKKIRFRLPVTLETV